MHLDYKFVDSYDKIIKDCPLNTTVKQAESSSGDINEILSLPGLNQVWNVPMNGSRHWKHTGIGPARKHA